MRLRATNFRLKVRAAELPYKPKPSWSGVDVAKEPEVLPPDESPEAGHLSRFADMSKALGNRIRELARTVEYYTPRVQNRDELHRTIRLFQQKLFELDEYVSALSKIEEKWEEEEWEKSETMRLERQRRSRF